MTPNTNTSSLAYLTLQAQTLNRASRNHLASGNSVLANCMKESAEYFENRCNEINDILDSMSLGNYRNTSRRSEREKYTADWMAYEEEYAYNFCGEN